MDIKNIKKLVEYIIFDNRRYQIVGFMLESLLDSNYESYKELCDDPEYHAQLNNKIKAVTTDYLELGTNTSDIGDRFYPKFNKVHWEDYHFDSLTYWTLIMTYCEYYNTNSIDLPVDWQVKDYYEKEGYSSETINRFCKEPHLGLDIERVETLLTECDVKDIDNVLKEFLKDARLKFNRRVIREASTIKNGNVRVYYKHTYMETSSRTDTYRDDERKWQTDHFTFTLPTLEWEELETMELNKDIVKIQAKWYNFFGKKLYRKLRAEMRAEVEALTEVSKDSPLYEKMMSFLNGTCHRSDNRTWIRSGARDFLVLFDLIKQEDYQF